MWTAEASGAGSVMLERVSQYELMLLGGFALYRDGELVPLPHGVQRLVAYLALHDGLRSRSRVAADLWVEVPDDRAQANLRSALWRVGQAAADLVCSDGGTLRLADVSIDVQEALCLARRLLGQTAHDGDRLLDIDCATFSATLLPDWYDDWVMLEREHVRQLCLHGLEALARRLTATGQHGRAVEAAMAAVSGEPLRESAQRVLLEAHLAEGNRSEAIRQYERYTAHLRDELGLEPPAELLRLVRG